MGPGTERKGPSSHLPSHPAYASGLEWRTLGLLSPTCSYWPGNWLFIGERESLKRSQLTGYWTWTQLPSWAPCLSERPDPREGCGYTPAHGRGKSPLWTTAPARERGGAAQEGKGEDGTVREREVVLPGKAGVRTAQRGSRGICRRNGATGSPAESRESTSLLMTSCGAHGCWCQGQSGPDASLHLIP